MKSCYNAALLYDQGNILYDIHDTLANTVLYQL